jgi:hypothetical protein
MSSLNFSGKLIYGVVNSGHPVSKCKFNKYN